MSRSKIVGIVCGVVAVLSLALAVCVAFQPVAMGADPNTPPAQVSWVTLLAGLFSGTTVASIAAFWKAAQPTVATIAKVVLPGVPVPPADLSKASQDVIELAAAVTFYLAHKDDENAKRRFILAALTEVGDITPPAVAAPLSALTSAIMSIWFPAPKA